MHPAFSVIFLTTLIGIAQGLFLALITAQTYSVVQLVADKEPASFYAFGTLIVLLFLAGGLVASFFHLGRPERAWRTVSQWRTSWLSREVIALPLFGFAVLIYGVIHWFDVDFVLFNLSDKLAISFSLIVGLVAAVLSFALFICTGMIYACIRFLQEWATPLTVINFIMLGLASGFTVAAAYAAYSSSGLVGLYAGWAIIFIVFAAITRISALIRNSRIKPKTTMTSAIGIRHDKIKQIAQGAMGGAFNTREYFHGQSVAFFNAMKWMFLLLTFVVPFALLVIGLLADQYILVFLIAAVTQYVGLLAERWFFFAQANHPQNYYYQTA